MGNKKNIFIGLSTLLLVLLLGLSTRTYADTNRTWEADDVRNVIYHYYIGEESKTDAETTAFISNNGVLIQEITNKLNNTDNVIITHVGQQQAYGLVFICSAHANPQFYQSSRSGNNFLNVNNRDGNDIFYYFTYQFNTGSQTNLANISSFKYFNTFLYTSTPIRSGSPNGSILFDVGYTAPSNLFIGPYTQVDDGIRFIPYPTKVSDVYIGQNYDLTAYGINKYITYKQTIFGDLIQPPGYSINEINVTMAYYNRGKSKWVEKFLLLETGEDLVPSNYKSSIANFKWQNWDGSTYTITYRALIDNEYVHDDCLYFFTFVGEYSDGTPFYIEQAFYIIGSNTVLVDGTLDISFLETGDYSNEYANDLNELASKIDDQNDLINAVEQGNINSWLPGSGDWSSLIGLVGSGEDIVNTANLWGFRNYTNSYWAGLYEMMNATYTVLSQTGTVALDVSFHGYNHAITSADIPAPPPTIRNTIALCLTTFVMISIYKSFSKKIEKLKMVDTSVLKSEAHDDSDLM